MPNPLFQKRHFEWIAGVLKECKADAKVVEQFAKRLNRTNPQFDRDRFIDAAGNQSTR